VVKNDRERGGTILWTALQAISGLRVALTPFLPFTSDRLGAMLGLGPVVEWSRPELAGGHPIGPVEPLFTKLDDEVLDE